MLWQRSTMAPSGHSDALKWSRPSKAARDKVQLQSKLQICLRYNDYFFFYSFFSFFFNRWTSPRFWGSKQEEVKDRLQGVRFMKVAEATRLMPCGQTDYTKVSIWLTFFYVSLKPLVYDCYCIFSGVGKCMLPFERTFFMT